MITNGLSAFHESSSCSLARVSTGDLTAGELRILVAIAGEGSFTAAAQRLGLTQSAVSHAVRTVERKIGAVLFQRGRSGAQPTEAGATTVRHARRILRLMDTMRQEAGIAAAGGTTGTIRVASFRSAAFHLLPGVLSRFGQRCPRVTVDVSVVPETDAGVPGKVRDGLADVGVTALFPPVDDLVTRQLFEDSYVLAYPTGHPDPRSLPTIHWKARTSAETEAWCARQDWLSANDIRVEDDDVAMSMVRHGLGAAVVPRLTLGSAHPAVAVQELGPDAPIRRIGYVTTPEMLNSAAVRGLIAELRAQRTTEHRPSVSR
ncbi:LysR family transcriptional regulator [Streptomyces cuspidosporus]|uniref:LysR family transcriptional regulator n=1 Tax=Streptomyces cuspidosporus TaxID=66882 RepID=A0ABN3FCC6_9ACTN